MNNMNDSLRKHEIPSTSNKAMIPYKVSSSFTFNPFIQAIRKASHFTYTFAQTPLGAILVGGILLGMYNKGSENQQLQQLQKQSEALKEENKTLFVENQHLLGRNLDLVDENSKLRSPSWLASLASNTYYSLSYAGSFFRGKAVALETGHSPEATNQQAKNSFVAGGKQ